MRKIEYTIEWDEYSPEELEAMSDEEIKRLLAILNTKRGIPDHLTTLIKEAIMHILYHKLLMNDAEISRIVDMDKHTVGSWRIRNKYGAHQTSEFMDDYTSTNDIRVADCASGKYTINQLRLRWSVRQSTVKKFMKDNKKAIDEIRFEITKLKRYKENGIH